MAEVYYIHRVVHDEPDHGSELRGEIRHVVISDADFDGDLRIIGWGLAAASLWVVAFRIGQMMGMLS